jgi:hypothetical protein
MAFHLDMASAHFMLHMRSGATMAAQLCVAKASRAAYKLLVTHTGFAFPLAKRDYHCFNKGQRALANGARLGFASIQGL